MKLEILDELQELIPPLQPEELERLHKSLDVEGRALDPLIVWEGKNIIVDGHNRYAYCIKHGYPFQIHEKSFSSLDVVKNYMVIRQLGRRNLDPVAISILRGKLYNWRKQDVPNPEGKNLVKGQNDPQPKSPTTAEKIAKETGVSPKTIKRDGELAKAVETLGIEAEVISRKDKRSKREIIEAATGKKPKPTPKPSVQDTGGAFLTILELLPELDQPQLHRLTDIIKTRWMRGGKDAEALGFNMEKPQP